jgi:hypothetical protein
MFSAWCCDQNGASALLLACASGHLDVAQWLVVNAGSNARSERTTVSRWNRCVSLFLCIFVAQAALFSALCDAIRMAGRRFCWLAPRVTLLWLSGLWRTPVATRDRSESTCVSWLFYRRVRWACSDCDVSRLPALCGVVIRMVRQPCCLHAAAVTVQWRSGSLQTPAAMHDRSEPMSVVAIVVCHLTAAAACCLLRCLSRQFTRRAVYCRLCVVIGSDVLL